MVDRDRQRFQLHSLLREQLRNMAPVGELATIHARALEALFRNWEARWRECIFDLSPFRALRQIRLKGSRDL